jgi:hypothetical protein
MKVGEIMQPTIFEHRPCLDNPGELLIPLYLKKRKSCSSSTYFVLDILQTCSSQGVFGPNLNNICSIF